MKREAGNGIEPVWNRRRSVSCAVNKPEVLRKFETQYGV
jgi:hypothetical protein